MKALYWNNKHDVCVVEAPDPKILNPRDAIIKITATAICGSGSHLLDGYIQTMKAGDVLVTRVHGRSGGNWPEVKNLKVSDRHARKRSICPTRICRKK